MPCQIMKHHMPHHKNEDENRKPIKSIIKQKSKSEIQVKHIEINWASSHDALVMFCLSRARRDRSSMRKKLPRHQHIRQTSQQASHETLVMLCLFFGRGGTGATKERNIFRHCSKYVLAYRAANHFKLCIRNIRISNLIYQLEK